MDNRMPCGNLEAKMKAGFLGRSVDAVMCFEEVQNKSPQKMPLWLVDYFELKRQSKPKETEGELFTSPLTT